MSERWTADRAAAWYAAQPWLVGSNYNPSTSGSPIETWQAETYDLETINRELGWAEAIGMNSMRVFLHHLVWEADPTGFIDRFTRFLDVADRRGISIMPVLFDTWGGAEPRLGPQDDPVPGMMCSRWGQGPGRDRLEDNTGWGRLEEYARDVVSKFARDPRVVVWDLYNEAHSADPGGPPLTEFFNTGNLLEVWGPSSERWAELSNQLLDEVFDWVRAESPDQPLTACIMASPGPWTPEGLRPEEHSRIDKSDIVSFHCYEGPETFRKRVTELGSYGRPLLCTEYLARTINSTIPEILPIGAELKVAMYNWGLVNGRTQTHFPGTTLQEPLSHEPEVWYHDLFHIDGTPYDDADLEAVSRLTKERAG